MSYQPYKPKKYENLLGLKGFSDQLLNNHFTLYQGYVVNTNKLNGLLVTLEKENRFGAPEYSELNRRFGWEFNGMRLHEYYFDSLTRDSTQLDKNSDFFKKIEENFDSFANFEKDFKSMGAMRGIGWVILYYDVLANRLFNVWINEHDVGHLAGCVPLLILDIFEHAYMIDYGTKKADYINAFFNSINWEIIKNRFEVAAK